jgi:methyltransferase (TIGR00027 family)
VVLGAGLDTFAQRRTDLAGRVRVFEVDQPGTQAWKQRRLAELGYVNPDWLHFVPSDFEVEGGWLKELLAAGFDPAQPAVVASTGVSMYLTKDATAATLREIAGLVPGTTLVMSFLLPPELLAAVDRSGLEMAERGAAAAGTPFLSFFTPEQIVTLAREAGFTRARHVSSAEVNARYFTGRPDGLHLPTGEDLLTATV